MVVSFCFFSLFSLSLLRLHAFPPAPHRDPSVCCNFRPFTQIACLGRYAETRRMGILSIRLIYQKQRNGHKKIALAKINECREEIILNDDIRSFSPSFGLVGWHSARLVVITVGW